ncbi:MAG: hypothetical protein ACR2P4_06000 [Gammaproteobacteria bacterium]
MTRYYQLIKPCKGDTIPAVIFAPPLQGYIFNNADSRGVAPCYNMPPFQGFYTAPPALFYSYNPERAKSGLLYRRCRRLV